jgi:hypothetical protein
MTKREVQKCRAILKRLSKNIAFWLPRATNPTYGLSFRRIVYGGIRLKHPEKLLEEICEEMEAASKVIRDILKPKVKGVKKGSPRRVIRT